MTPATDARGESEGGTPCSFAGSIIAAGAVALAAGDGQTCVAFPHGRVQCYRFGLDPGTSAVVPASKQSLAADVVQPTMGGDNVP